MVVLYGLSPPGKARTSCGSNSAFPLCKGGVVHSSCSREGRTEDFLHLIIFTYTYLLKRYACIEGKEGAVLTILT